VDHLAVDDVIEIVNYIKPETVLLTHFGMNLIKEKPDLVAERIKDITGMNIVAAYDGMKYEF
jgi:ribonuclease BN (tRNA processing enzyme)